jgi:hypothetical protein
MKMQTVEQAKKVLGDLISKHEALEAKKAALELQRDEIAFDALALGEDRAKAQLTKVGKTLFEVDNELGAMSAAIREAEQRVQIAEGTKRAEIERKNAEQALKLGRAAMDAINVADKGLRDAFNALTDADAAIHELSRLGCPPSPGLFSVNVRRAIAAASIGTRFPVGQHMTPSERRSLSELADGWQRNIEAWAAQRLDPPKVKELAA